MIYELPTIDVTQTTSCHRIGGKAASMEGGGKISATMARQKGENFATALEEG
jgi:hypothetical protein